MSTTATEGTTARKWLLSYPTLMLGVFFVGPFGIMLAVSFFQRVESAFYKPAFVFSNYARLFSSLFLDNLAFSLYLGMLVAVISVSVAFPFTYLLSRMRMRTQTIWLVFLLSVLSLSEVIIAFSWSILLSRTAGVSNLLVWLGLMDHPVGLAPGFTAEVLGYCYLTLPYTVLMLYPSMSRLDPELTEAARTLGASPQRAFFNVVIPAMRQPIVASLILVFVFTLGVYLIPQILGNPEHWTLSVLITDQAVYQSNVPFAAALAVFLLLTSLALILLTFVLGARERIHTAS
ncbi:Spermidine/putrescine transport system permease protein PotB [wastewater metagenome]|uniref:Spermidine/putrescine transport system permease protein PotB n=3 Tax=root TaxID=1 RepID=A0A5B8REI9_9ZZZZ|nr:ABC transporter permease [Arhodomonas aquaeolei]MCS4503349.1 ABC transporter permease [Arhodomonas aquaeolei]QEA06966.1 spermidine/putrescine transport system permease protein PotB [uncultured organism]